MSRIIITSKIVSVFILILFYGCAENKGSQYDSRPTAKISGSDNDSIQATPEISIRKDTVFKNFMIVYDIVPTKEKIHFYQYDEEGTKEESFTYDNAVSVTISNLDKVIFSRKFLKSDFGKYMPAKIGQYQLSVFNIEELDHENFTFFVNICKPESDNCYPFTLSINRKGAYQIKEAEEEL